MTDLRVTRVPDLSHVDRDEWDALLATSVTGTVFQSYSYQDCWWRHYEGSHTPLILEVRTSDGAIVAFASLAIERRRPPTRWSTSVMFAGSPHANYQDFVVGEPYEAALRALLEWLARQGESGQSFRFSRILDSSPTFQHLPRIAEDLGFTTISRENMQAPLLELGGDPREHRRLTRKKKMREGLNRLKREGTVSFSRISDADHALAELPSFFDMHVRRRSVGATAPSQFVEATQRAFLEDLIRTLAPSGALGIDVLRLDRSPIAYQVFLVDKRADSIVLILPTFDPEYGRFSPGLVLLGHTLETSMDQAFRTVDFSIGEHDYKYRFANRVRSVHSIFLFVNRPEAGLVWSWWVVRNFLQHVRRRYPDAIRTLKRTFYTFRS